MKHNGLIEGHYVCRGIGSNAKAELQGDVGLVQDDVSTAHLRLAKAGGGTGWAIVDASDYDRVSSMGVWHEVIDGRTSYAVQFDRFPSGAVTRRHLHRVIVGARAGVHVDHINGDGLDCRRVNLRELTGAENGQNRRGANSNSRSGIRGVRWHERDKRWEAALKLDRRVISLGYYRDIGDAAAVVIEARRRLMPFSVEEELPTPVSLSQEEIDQIVSTRIGRMNAVQ